MHVYFSFHVCTWYIGIRDTYLPTYIRIKVLHHLDVNLAVVIAYLID